MSRLDHLVPAAKLGEGQQGCGEADDVPLIKAVMPTHALPVPVEAAVLGAGVTVEADLAKVCVQACACPAVSHERSVMLLSATGSELHLATQPLCATATLCRCKSSHY